MQRKLAVVLFTFGVAAASAAQQYTIIGSKTMYAMNVALASRFEREHPAAKLRVSGDGTAKGFEAVVQRKADAAAMSRALRPEEKAALPSAQFVPVALEGISVYLHPRNPLTNLEPAQVFAIFSGRITNWKDLGGPNAPIHVYSFDKTTGRYWYLFDELMKREAFVKDARYTTEDAPLARKEEQMLDWVSHDANAIGFGDLKKVRVVKIAKILGYWPTPDDIRSAHYPFARRLGYVIAAKASGLFGEFLKWAPKQADLIRDAGFVPIE